MEGPYNPPLYEGSRIFKGAIMSARGGDGHDGCNRSGLSSRCSLGPLECLATDHARRAKASNRPRVNVRSAGGGPPTERRRRPTSSISGDEEQPLVPIRANRLGHPLPGPWLQASDGHIGGRVNSTGCVLQALSRASWSRSRTREAARSGVRPPMSTGCVSAICARRRLALAASPPADCMRR